MIVGTAPRAAELIAPYFAAGGPERVVALHLDGERRLLALTIEQEGASDSADLPIRALLATALRLGACGIIVAHNHPSGDPAPSPADVDATRRLAEAARELDIRVFDHLILAGGEYSSMRGLGLL